MNDAKKTITTPGIDGSATAVFGYLKGLWQELLRVPDIKPEDNFFTLGGDSVLVIEMLLAVSSHFDREFEYNKFFPKPNLATLSALIVADLKANYDQSRR